jgi:triosephosphate isomerase
MSSKNLPLVVLNWKMFLKRYQLDLLINEIKHIDYRGLIVMPSTTHIEKVSNILGENIAIGGQNISHLESGYGAYTGEISCQMLKEYNCKYCLVGHSERRQYNSETYQEINKKIDILSNNNITSILCVGENLQEKQHGMTIEIIEEQINSALNNQFLLSTANIVLAYEPVWSIGTGNIPTTQEISYISKYIKDYCIKKFDKIIQILYGGSVNEDNIEEILAINSINGVLVGSASKDILQIKKIIEIAQKI